MAGHKRNLDETQKVERMQQPLKVSVGCRGSLQLHHLIAHLLAHFVGVGQQPGLQLNPDNAEFYLRSLLPENREIFPTKHIYTVLCYRTKAYCKEQHFPYDLDKI